MILPFVISAEPNSLRSQWVKSIARDSVTTEVRTHAFQAALDANLQALIVAQWADSTPLPEPEGARVWYAYQQRASDELLDQVIFAVFAVLLQDGTLDQMTTAGAAVLSQSPLQATLYTKLQTAFANATQAERTTFVALALTVAYGKIGQR